MATYHPPNAGPSRPYDSSFPNTAPARAKSPSPSFPQNFDKSAWSDGLENGRGPASLPELGADPSSRSAEVDSSKRNPLVDLMDTEKVYVEQLGMVIRRVAAAWSRKDFPPPQLDAMFRCVEAVYRANRSFGTKLKEIGPNPSSPKALGDLLMRWIDDLESPYQRYSTSFLSGFDSYTPANSNPLLPGILVEITAISPPPPPLKQWSLDALFILPYTRLRYYRKLYARLLRSTKEGRSDHRLLLVANQRLDVLISEAAARLDIDVAEDESEAINKPREHSWQERERVSRTSSAMESSVDSQPNFSPFSSRIEDSRNSSGSVATSVHQSPARRPAVVVSTMSVSAQPVSPTTALSDLEYRIDTERALDLFTMAPKKCKLQMNPPSLPFRRALRASYDVSVYFAPKSTGQQVVHSRAHVFILSDLFLVGEWMEAGEKAAKAQQVAFEHPERVGQGGPMPEMWLSYPPLAGKHLAVAEGSQVNVLMVNVMRKETFVIHTESEIARDQMMKDIAECIDFATNISRRNTALASPNAGDMRSPSALSDTRSSDAFPPLRYPSPFSPASSPSASPRPSDTQEMPPPPMSGNILATQMNNLVLQPGEAFTWPSGAPPVQPQGAAVVPAGGEKTALPPRGASLRMRQSSTTLPIPTTTLQVSQMPVASSSASRPSGARGAPLPRSSSGRSVQSAPRPQHGYEVPPVPQLRAFGSHLSEGPHSTLMLNGPARSRSADPLRPPNLPLDPPSARFSSFPGREDPNDTSPPMSPEQEDAATLTGPAVISAQMKCKVFLKQAHQQWKSLGSGKLKLYLQRHGNIKQLVVESDSNSRAMLISTIVLTDGVERVAKTGVAVEISDRGKRTGIIYMIQLRNENSAAGLFESLLVGSDRAVLR